MGFLDDWENRGKQQKKKKRKPEDGKPEDGDFASCFLMCFIAAGGAAAMVCLFLYG